MTYITLTDVEALLRIRDMVECDLPLSRCEIASVLVAAGYDPIAEVRCAGCGESATAPIETEPDPDIPGDLLCLKCAA